MERIQLSHSFYLNEFTRSDVAARMGRDIVIPRDSDVYRDVRRLSEYVLQPVRDALGPVFITSGYRPPWLNKAIGGAPTSQHMKGQAADIVVSGFSPYEVCAWLIGGTLPFDQLIHEFGQWTHVSIAPQGQTARREVLTAFKEPRGVRRRMVTVYANGLRTIEELAA